MEKSSPEDRFIRNLILVASSAAVVGLLALGTVITVLVSANFNVLEWME